MSKKDGGPAFPSSHEIKVKNQFGGIDTHMAFTEGMTVRDYFAAKAMQSLIANPRDYSSVRDNLSMAATAYAMADAMLTVRNVNGAGEE